CHAGSHQDQPRDEQTHRPRGDVGLKPQNPCTPSAVPIRSHVTPSRCADDFDPTRAARETLWRTPDIAQTFTAAPNRLLQTSTLAASARHGRLSAWGPLRQVHRACAALNSRAVGRKRGEARIVDWTSDGEVIQRLEREVPEAEDVVHRIVEEAADAGR